ncbi:MAG TPA: hypothetical protein VGE50_05295 [Gammaproteobacteria bacterium]
MKITPPLFALLSAALLGLAGCGDSPQPGSTPPPSEQARQTPSQGTTAPSAATAEAPPQNAMGVRPAEERGAPPSSAPVPAGPAAVAPTSPAVAPPLPVSPAPATPQAPAPAAPQTASAKGTLLKESELKEKPFIDAATLAKLAAQSPVTIRERSGGWFRVSAAGREGWVRMLNVKVTEGAESLSSGTDLTQAATLATGRAGSGNVVSTSGLRGLSEEELRTAQPDYAQFDKLNSYGVDKNTASSYAKSNGLKSRSVQYLPAPAK